MSFNSLTIPIYLNNFYFLGGPSTPRSTAGEYFPEDPSRQMESIHSNQQVNPSQPVNPSLQGNRISATAAPRSSRSTSQSQGSSSSSIESLASSSSREVSSFESNYPPEPKVWLSTFLVSFHSTLDINHSNSELFVRYSRDDLNNKPFNERSVLDQLNTKLVHY